MVALALPCRARQGLMVPAHDTQDTAEELSPAWGLQWATYSAGEQSGLSKRSLQLLLKPMCSSACVNACLQQSKGQFIHAHKRTRDNFKLLNIVLMDCFMWFIHTLNWGFVHCYGPITASFLQQVGLITDLLSQDSYCANTANSVLQTCPVF